MAVQSLCSENLGLLPIGCGGGGSQDWFMNSVMGIEDDVGCFNLQEQQQQMNQVLQSHQSIGFNRYQGAPGVCGISPMTSSSSPQSLTSLLEKQRLEIDWVLHLQSERLKMALREERKKQLSCLVQGYESRYSSLIYQKEKDLAMASKITMELEACLRKTELESQTWQIRATENEARVADLHNTLSQVKARISQSHNTSAPEAESFCDTSNQQDEQEDEESGTQRMACKLCNVQFSCVVFLPCRHLCSCKSCEAYLGFCPVCETLKEASMEVFLA